MAEEMQTAERPLDPCAALAEEIEVLIEQIGTLEEGMPAAPGTQRAALAKEITAYREHLDSMRRALRQCRGERDW
jgi:hypothetical protein